MACQEPLNHSLLGPACFVARSLLVRMKGEGERKGDKAKAHLVATFWDMSWAKRSILMYYNQNYIAFSQRLF